MRPRPRASHKCERGLLGRAPGRDDLIGRPAGKLSHMIEFEDEGANASGGRTHFDNQVTDFGFRHLRPHGIPAIPTFAGIEAQYLAPTSRQDSIHLRSRFARADDFDFMDRLKQDRLALRQPFHDPYTTRGAERLI